MKRAMLAALIACTSAACVHDGAPVDEAGRANDGANALVEKYTTFPLTADLSALSDAERRMIPLLVEAAREMDAIF